MIAHAGSVNLESKVEYNNIQAKCCTGDNDSRNKLIIQQTATEFTTPRNGAEHCHHSRRPNGGRQTSSDATTDNNKNMQEELLSNATTDNDPDMQVTDDQILQINVLQDEIDLLCPGTEEDPPESPATDNLRDRTNQPELAKSEPGSDDIEMVAEPPKEPDTTP